MDPQVNYLNAVRSYNRVRAEAAEAAKRLRLAASFLETPRNVVVTGTETEFDPRHTGPDPRAVAATDIPSASEVASVIARFQRADAEVYETWAGVPEDERDGLTYPGELQ